METIKVRDFRRKRVSWGSIIAGVVTVFAVSILLSILGSSIGLFMFDPQSSDPTAGIGTTIGIWTVISLLISLAAGGLVAGKLAGTDGIIHGFLVWATTTIATVIMLVCLTVGTVKMTLNILGSISSVAGNVITNVTSAVGSGVSNLGEQVQEVFDFDFSGNVDKKEVRQDVRQALRKSGVKEFQPEYLEREMNNIKSDFNRTLKKLATQPNDAETIINDFVEKVKTRTENAFKDVDRNDLSKAIANNSNMSKAEVDRVTDEYLQLINNARKQAKEQVENLEDSIEQAKNNLEEMKQEALKEADKASSAAASSALISFFALLAGAALCSFAGSYGSKKTHEGYEA